MFLANDRDAPGARAEIHCCFNLGAIAGVGPSLTAYFPDNKKIEVANYRSIRLSAALEDLTLAPLSRTTGTFACEAKRLSCEFHWRHWIVQRQRG